MPVTPLAPGTDCDAIQVYLELGGLGVRLVLDGTPDICDAEDWTMLFTR